MRAESTGIYVEPLRQDRETVRRETVRYEREYGCPYYESAYPSTLAKEAAQNASYLFYAAHAILSEERKEHEK